MDTALVITSTTTSATRSYLLLTFPIMKENPDTAVSKSPVGEDEAATAQSGILLYSIMWKGYSNHDCFEWTIVLLSDGVELIGIFLCGLVKLN